MFADPGGLSVDALYRNTSQGQISFSGTVVGPYEIPNASTEPCNLGAWADAAEVQAEAAGVDLTAYARRCT